MSTVPEMKRNETKCRMKERLLIFYYAIFLALRCEGKNIERRNAEKVRIELNFAISYGQNGISKLFEEIKSSLSAKLLIIHYIFNSEAAKIWSTLDGDATRSIEIQYCKNWIYSIYLKTKRQNINLLAIETNNTWRKRVFVWVCTCVCVLAHQIYHVNLIASLFEKRLIVEDYRHFNYDYSGWDIKIKQESGISENIRMYIRTRM